MRPGRPAPAIVLTTDERDMLEPWTRRPKPAQALALRVRLVLRCAAGETPRAIARDLQVIKHMVGKWRGRFVAPTTDGMLDEPRPGVPRKITDTHVERVLTATLESTPRDAAHCCIEADPAGAGFFRRSGVAAFQRSLSRRWSTRRRGDRSRTGGRTRRHTSWPCPPTNRSRSMVGSASPFRTRSPHGRSTSTQ
jgi:transposase